MIQQSKLLQELVAVASLSKDQAMLDVFKRKKWNPIIKDENGNDIEDPYTDLHYVAAETIQPWLKSVPISNKMKEAKRELPELNGKSSRFSAKAMNFGLIYGLSANSLASDMAWELSYAESVLMEYFKGFPQLKRWLDVQAVLGKERKWIRTASNRLCFIAESNAKGIDDANGHARKACNAAVQSSCADMMKMALRKVHPFAKSHGCKLVAVVHDRFCRG